MRFQGSLQQLINSRNDAQTTPNGKVQPANSVNPLLCVNNDKRSVP